MNLFLDLHQHKSVKKFNDLFKSLLNKKKKKKQLSPECRLLQYLKARKLPYNQHLNKR